MAIEININQVRIGTSFIEVSSDPNNINGKVIKTSYATGVEIQGVGVIQEVAIGGVPLSVSSYMFSIDPSAYPEATILSNLYYTLDIISITGVEDTSDTKYDDNSFVWGGSRLSNLRQENKNYMNITAGSEAIQPYHNVTIGGVNFATDEDKNLIINQSGYTIDDVEMINPSGSELDVKEVMIGGVPLMSGRVGNKYYLIVNTLY